MSSDDLVRERTKAVAHRFYEELWSNGSESAVDEIIAEDLIYDQLPSGWPCGRSGFKQLLGIWRRAFPDMAERVQSMIAEGSWVAVRFVFTGTNRGEFYGIPATMRSVELPGVDLLRIGDGQIAEWIYAGDSMSFFRQLGQMPPDWDAVAF
jgi:steroid delta-isomerase-like uncharacterized protein